MGSRRSFAAGHGEDWGVTPPPKERLLRQPRTQAGAGEEPGYDVAATQYTG